MIFTTEDLKARYGDYVDYKGKIRREVEEGRLFRIRQGLYEDDPSVDGACLASAVYSPSYLSFDYALSRHGLIPEGAYSYTSATFRKGKSKEHRGYFGTFLYRDIPAKAYPYGIMILEEKGYPYGLATPEKALCDKLYAMPPVSSVKRIREMLFEDLRIAEDAFYSLSMEDLLFLSPLYASNNLRQLERLIKEGRRWTR